MPGFKPIATLLAEIEANPIEGAKAAQKRHDGVRTANYESSVSAGALYRELKGSPSLISAFYELQMWQGDENKKAYKKNSKHLNKHCHQFVYGAREGSEGKRAEDHASATQSYYDDESKTVEQILEALKRKGFDGPKKAATAQKNRSKKTETDASKRSSAGSSSVGEDASQTNRSSNSEGEPPQPGSPEMTEEEIFDCLLVTVEPDELALFLDDESNVGDRYLIEVEREADDANGALVWRAIEITKTADEA